MATRDWIEVPVGLDAGRWVTLTGLRTVLVVAHSVTALQRLLDVTSLFETDLRIQTVFTQGPGAFSPGVDRLIEDLGCVAMPWAQATYTTFDLALASGYTSLHELHAPIIVIPHGAGYNKFVPVKRANVPAIAAVYGLNPQQLIRDGNVVPSIIGLSHKDEIQTLKEQCPEAVGNASVIGDPCLDRILASRPRRDHYRASLGVSEHEKLLVISSTWGPHSLLGSAGKILGHAMAEAEDNGFIVAVLLHPGIWTGHGRRQVRQWFQRYTSNGMLLIGPDEEWRAALVGADWVISDHGSTCLYAIAAGSPVLHTDVPPNLIVPGSAIELVHSLTPPLRENSPIYPQLLESKATFVDSAKERIMERLTSAFGQSATLTRRIIYDQLNLDEPPGVATLHTVSPIKRSGQIDCL